MLDPRPWIPVVVGPTGVGKTEMAVRLAEALGGEVVVADSRQVYRDLHVATNHPGPDLRRRARFHMIEVADPRAGWNAHDYVRGATAAIEAILARSHRPVVEGGTGLYVDALMDGLSLGQTPPVPERRAELESLDTPALASLLVSLDPRPGVDLRNRRRLVRAIELVESTGRALSDLRRRSPPPWRPVRIGLLAPPEVVEARLGARVTEQLRRGVVEETRAALAAGVPASAPVLSGIGYAEALRHLRGELDEAALAVAMLSANRRYARRQLTWWRRDPRVRWFPIDPDPLPGILEYLVEPAG